MTPLARNIELKARLRSLAEGRQIAASVATNRLGVERQVDTYFHCAHGRLKLREIEHCGAQLIWYARPNDPLPKASDYRLLKMADPNGLKEALAAALGVLVVVDKRREILYWRNVRIHLDEIVGLGQFLEFESVLGGAIDDAAGRAQIAFLREQFMVADDDLIADSYSDLLMKRTAGG